MLKRQVIFDQILVSSRKIYPLLFLSCPIPFWEILEFSSVLSDLSPISSDFLQILSDVFKIPREGIKISREGIAKKVRQNYTNNVLFYHKRRVVSLEWRDFSRKCLKLAIFKRSENRIFPNNFFWVRKVALNRRVRFVNICCDCAGCWMVCRDYWGWLMNGIEWGFIGRNLGRRDWYLLSKK